MNIQCEGLGVYISKKENKFKRIGMLRRLVNRLSKTIDGFFSPYVFEEELEEEKTTNYINLYCSKGSAATDLIRRNSEKEYDLFVEIIRTTVSYSYTIHLVDAIKIEEDVPLPYPLDIFLVFYCICIDNEQRAISPNSDIKSIYSEGNSEWLDILKNQYLNMGNFIESVDFDDLENSDSILISELSDPIKREKSQSLRDRALTNRTNAIAIYEFFFNEKIIKSV